MMLVRSTILMPSSAPGIFSLSVRNRTRLPSPRRGVTGSGTATQNAGGNEGRASAAPRTTTRIARAVAAGDRRRTFAEAWQRGVRLANGLIALHLHPQDRVGLLEDNTLESTDLFLGAAIANVVRLPLYPRNARESHLHMLAHTGCRDSCLHLAPIWLAGGRNVMVEKFDPVILPDLMIKERTAYMFMVPIILNATNRIPGIERKKFPHLKWMLVSAAPISDETALKAYEIFGDAMYQGYGQTEVLPIARARSHCAPAACRCPSRGCRSGTRTTSPCSASSMVKAASDQMEPRAVPSDRKRVVRTVCYTGHNPSG